MRSSRWLPALAVALVATGVVTACETVPYTGRTQLQFMSPQQESEMGARVGSRIAAVTGHPEYKWEYWPVQAVASLIGAGPQSGLFCPGAGPRSRKPTTWDSS